LLGEKMNGRHLFFEWRDIGRGFFSKILFVPGNERSPV